MTYSVKEIFLTLQGEGAHAGRAAVFCRFSGCNLWSGREEDRATAICQFCDTDFVGTDGEGGGKNRTMTPRDAVTELWQVLKSWESSLRQLCPGDASAVRDVRNNIQTAAGSRFAMESFGQTIADDILDVRGRLLGEQAQLMDLQTV